MRIACLLVPDLPLHAELRASPELKGLPLVITNGHGFRAETLAVSHEAFAQGVRPGQTLPQARAVCPEIEARIASPILERAAREAMLDVALSLAPRAELAERASGLFLSEGAVYVDAGGIEALHTSESAFASVLHARAERAGIRGVVALASSRGIARLTARHLAHLPASPSDSSSDSSPGEAPSETTRILSPEEESAFLSPLPIDLLDPDDRTAQALTRFGIHCIRDLLRLSRRDLAARLGPGLLALVARARGEESEPPLSEPRATSLEEGIDLEAPIESLEPLAFVFRGLVSRLTERLTLRSLGCVELCLALQLANGARESRRIGVASPCQDERVLLRLLRLALESKPPVAAIERVTLTSLGVPLRREQLDFFLPRGPSPTELDQTLAELAAICGTERVGTPLVVDDHRPDAFALKPFSKTKLRSKNDVRANRPQRKPRLTLRALRPPLRAEVRIEQGSPVFLRSAVSQGEILSSAGPWRTTGYWWEKSTHFAVDHYDVQMSDGSVLRLCFDWKTKRWQVDGLYD
jgi:protein ImuB